MATALKRLSKIDRKIKYGVYGWIRRAEIELEIANIPLMIQSICLLYFYQEEMFDIVNEFMKVSENRKCITKQSSWGWENCNYGSTQIQSMSSNKYTWNIKIRKLKPHGLWIGIKDSVNTNMPAYKASNYYLMWADGSIRTSNDSASYWKSIRRGSGSSKFRDNDDLALMLDLQSAELSLSVNHNNPKVIFKDIKKDNDIEYRLTASLFYVGDSVEILDFSTEYR